MRGAKTQRLGTSDEPHARPGLLQKKKVPTRLVLEGRNRTSDLRSPDRRIDKVTVLLFRLSVYSPPLYQLSYSETFVSSDGFNALYNL